MEAAQEAARSEARTVAEAEVIIVCVVSGLGLVG